MARIVCVHGISQQYQGEETLHTQWRAALRDGLRHAGDAGRAIAGSLADDEIRFAFYGGIFRPAGQTLDVGAPYLTAADTTEFEEQLADQWWREAARSDPGVSYPGADSLIRTPGGVQAALRALSGSAFFAGLGQRLMIGNLVQVRRYLTEPDVRRAVRQRVADAVDGETRVIVAHSLGSVVAYEALAAHPDWPVRALVTLGSPLGIANLIFDRLHPRPRPRTDLAAGEDGVRGGWPGPVTVWTNVADKGDVVALVKDLRPLFGERVVSCLVHNGATAHDIRPYLTAPETGTGILAGLTAAEHR
jgi:hypothetical protein